jgi:hypothetical protein
VSNVEYLAIPELYKKFNLIATKFIVLRIKKNIRKFDDWLKAELLQPSFIIENWDGYFIGWAINGKIRTKKQKEFYKDLSIRLKKSLIYKAKIFNVEVVSIWHLNFALENGYKEIHYKSYEMKDLAKSCLSLNKKEEKNKKIDIPTTLDNKEEFNVFAGTYTKSDDALYDFIRFRAYDYARINKLNKANYTLEDITNYCLQIAEIGYDIVGGKGISTAKAKARNIANWVYHNYGNGKRKRKIKSDEELLMTRRENALKLSKEKYKIIHNKLINIIKEKKEEFTKKDGSYNVNKLAKEIKVSRNTIYKHLKDENLI